jgi:uncharacterized protein RhaS with RHS repeats
VISWHRFYDPETGRYISADPIGLAGGLNLYAYVQGDPVNSIDPYGLMEATWGQIGMGLGGVTVGALPIPGARFLAASMIAGALMAGDTPIDQAPQAIPKPDTPPPPCNNDKCTCTSDITITDVAAGGQFSVGKISASAPTCAEAQTKLNQYANDYAAYKRGRNGTSYTGKHINKTHCVKH